jgi:DNA polymerase-3 subunit alpha
MDPFVHLHVHTDHSILDGHTTVPELAAEVARLGQPAVSMTDHGSIGGAKKHYDACNAEGIKPIIGCEFYVAPASRKLKEPVHWGLPEQRKDDVSNRGAYNHITVVATSAEGLRNLYRLHATSYADGFYYKPRIDLEILSEHNAGLVVTTGCAGGALATRIRLGQLNEGKEYLSSLRDVFGDRLYVEIMAHDNPIDSVINPSLIEMSRQFKIPLVATNDSHYTLEKDARSHDALLCLQTSQKVDGVRSFRFEGNGYHIRSHREMAELFTEIPDAVRNTLVIAERVESYREVFTHELKMPRFPDRGDTTAEVYLNSVLDASGEWTEADAAQRSYEMDVIGRMDFSDYFLVVADIVNWAKTQKIRVGPGRGSAGGSIVAYRLGITDLHPTTHGLLFERFLNPERVSLPDIDVDVMDTRRDEVLEYIVKKYGEDCVAQLGTYGIIGAKSAIHDATRVLGYSRRTGDNLTFRLPPMKFGRAPGLDEGHWEGLDTTESAILDLAQSFEGRIRNQGVHAAGVVISPVPLEDVIPLYRPLGKGGNITAFDMKEVDDSGLVKMDWLGLKNLSIIDDTVKTIDVPWDIPVLSTNLEDMTDAKAFDLLRSGNTLGVFQLDSPGMQQLLRSLRPTEFGDISAVLALYRPGPMGVNAHSGYAKRKNGKERVSYPHSELAEPLKEVLGPTYGLVVYQEQVLEILRICCGYTYATAENIFDAMRKKKTEKMLAAKPDFSQRMLANGYSQDAVEALWDVLVPFSDYSFNKAHTTGYGTISYWTAYLKANFPHEYMSALLSNEKDPKKLPQYVAEVNRMRIPILPPDINISEASWTPTAEGIRYGLISIKEFGNKAYDALLKKRPYKSLDDFFKRADRKVLNSKTLRVLIQSGAMDSLCPHRADLFLNHETLAERALSDRSLARKGEVPLYSSGYAVQPSSTNDYTLRQQWEQDLLGTVLSLEPVTMEAERWLNENEFYYIKEVVENNPGRQQLSLKLGYATIHVGYIDWSEKVKKMMDSILTT